MTNWDLMFTNYIAWLLVFIRTIGFIFFNPILGRRNIPTMVRIGLSFCMTVLIASTITTPPHVVGILHFAIYAVLELLVGWIFGYLVNLFLSITIFSGELYDLQMGISMSKIFDPSSNIQMPLIGSIYNTIFILYFFSSNSHLTLIKIFKASFGIIPVGIESFNENISMYIVTMFTQTIALGAKLALPMIGAQLMIEMGIGVLMKAVPQINVFSLNIQLKLIIGLMFMFVLLTPASAFIDNTITIMLERITYGLQLFANV